MQPNFFDFKYYIRRLGILALAFYFGLSLPTDAAAQKLPPLLKRGDTENSAFNKETIKTLETGYNENVKDSATDKQELARQYRNRLIAVGIEQTDAYFFNYQKNSRRKREWLQFLLDFLEIGAATAISITNGERAKTLIADGLGALQASRTSLNKNFKLLERQILLNQMAADRATVLELILKRLDQNAIDYPWEAARSDVRNYFNAGTLDSALTSLSVKTGKAAENAEAKVRRFKGKILSSATPLDKKAAENADAIKTELEDALDAGTKKVEVLKNLKEIVVKLEADPEISKLLKDKELSSASNDSQFIYDTLTEIIAEQTEDNNRNLVRRINQAFIDTGKLN